MFTAWFCVPAALLMVTFPMMMYFFANRIFPEQKKLGLSLAAAVFPTRHPARPGRKIQLHPNSSILYEP